MSPVASPQMPPRLSARSQVGRGGGLGERLAAVPLAPGFVAGLAPGFAFGLASSSFFPRSSEPATSISLPSSSYSTKP